MRMEHCEKHQRYYPADIQYGCSLCLQEDELKKRVTAAETKVKTLEAEVALLREAINLCRLAFCGYMSVQAVEDKLDSLESTPPTIVELAICESKRVQLQPNTLYRFHVDRECPACMHIMHLNEDRIDER